MEKLVNDEIQLFGACTVAAAAKTTHGTFNLDKNRHTHTKTTPTLLLHCTYLGLTARTVVVTTGTGSRAFVEAGEDILS